ncbi:winged helix-turn-helix transcriptional regulator [Streptomyces liangshanensis]|uniref:winged helix-turn-helix transcriptional regulator n=1 Tax=Streptomyces liangshanensis TaxID=2717324 RepID=UPI0036DB0A5C
MPVIRIDPTTLPGRPCSLASALELVGDRWSLLAVREVSFGNHRFSQIARNTGAPRDRLSARLKALVEGGILERRADPEGSRYEGYHLTQAGEELGPAVLMLMSWGAKWTVDSPPMGQTHHDHPLALTATCATCGHLDGADEVTHEMLVPHWNLAGPEKAAGPGKPGEPGEPGN